MTLMMIVNFIRYTLGAFLIVGAGAVACNQAIKDRDRKDCVQEEHLPYREALNCAKPR